MALRTILNKIVVKPDEVEDEITIGGIFIPRRAKDQPSTGRVVAVGAGLPDAPMIIKQGEHVFYTRFAGIKIDHEGETFIIIKETDILAVIKRGDRI